MADRSLLALLFEALPDPTFLVDADIQVLLANRAARALARVDPAALGEAVRRTGDLLSCVHATEHPEGCGRSEACRSCQVHGTVAEALGRSAPARRQAVLELGHGGRVTVTVSASPFQYQGTGFAALVLGVAAPPGDPP